MNQSIVRISVLALVVLALLSVPPIQLAAQEASPDASEFAAMSTEATQAAIDAYLAALVAREDIAPFFSDDIVLELVDVGQQIQGRDAVAGAIVELHEQTFDARPELTSLLVGEGTAAVEAIFAGTHTGEFVGIPATGREVAVPYAVFYDLAEGEITALRIHGFASGLVAALTAEAAPTTGTPTP